MMSNTGSFKDLKFTNTAVNELRIDPNNSNETRQVNGFHYSLTPVSGLKNPKIVGISKPACELLDLDPTKLLDEADYLIGNKIPAQAKPISHCYVGHQFGNLAGQLGDGRAISLGDVQNHKGEIWDIQFKGSGKTPYSRFADGRAVLRSSIREFLASEHMYFLGVPTTRALSCVVSSDTVARDIKYNGNVRQENCAVVIRLSPTFIRFGSFQLALKDEYNPQRGGKKELFDQALITDLADYTIKHFYPQYTGLPRDEAYTKFLEEVTERTLDLFVKWQSVGFIHGVLNTDNMSILGVTIDYGPYGFMEFFDDFQIINTSDEWGRYAYKNQPAIAKWNLTKLFECFQNILPPAKMKTLKDRLNTFESDTKKRLNALMCRKLGLLYPVESLTLYSLFKDCMDYSKTDWTNSFLMLEKLPKTTDLMAHEDLFYKLVWAISPTFTQWNQANKSRFSPDILEGLLANPGTQMYLTMQLGHFPKDFFEDQLEKTTARQQAVKGGEVGWRKDVESRWQNFLGVYADHLKKDLERYSQENPGANSDQRYWEERQKSLQQTNPAFILRNHLIQEAIAKADSGDFSEVETLLRLCCNPFDRNIDPAYQRTPTETTGEICLSCSS
jgi:uncharacterized protein YdiU (UPF0061 family)